MRFSSLRILCCFVLLTAFATSAFANRPDPASNRSIAVYNRGLAEITETRTVELDKGMSTVILPFISPEILSESIEITLLNGKNVATQSLSVVLDEFSMNDYWNKFIGVELNLNLGEEETASGILKMFNGEQLVLETEEGLTAIDRSSVEENLVIADLPDDLVTEPSILWTVQSKKAQKARIELRYQTDGMDWSATHRAELNDKNVTFASSFVFDNELPLTFAYDQLTFVGGAIHLAGDKRRVDRLNPAPGATTGDATSSFGDVHRWTIENAGKLIAGSTALFSVINTSATNNERFYLYDATIFDDRVSSHTEFTLNRAIPAGEVLIYDQHGKEMLFVGSDRIDDTPTGSPMDLTLNQVFDLTAERTRLSEKATPANGTSQEFRVVLGNSSENLKNVRVIERLFGDWSVANVQVNNADQKYIVENARTLRFDVQIQPGKTSTLNYEIRYAR